MSVCINMCRLISHIHSYFLINNSALVFEQLSPCCCGTRKSSRGWRRRCGLLCRFSFSRSSRGWRRCSLLGRAPPLCLAWIPSSGFRWLSPTTGGGTRPPRNLGILWWPSRVKWPSLRPGVQPVQVLPPEVQPGERRQQRQQLSAEPVVCCAMTVAKAAQRQGLNFWSERSSMEALWIHRQVLTHTDTKVLVLKLNSAYKLKKLVSRQNGIGWFPDHWHYIKMLTLI